MERFTLDENIKVFCVPAKSFPEGVLEAHQKLHGMVPYSQNRRYFGISRPEDDKIAYKAAAEELIDGELKQHGLDEFNIGAGEYICIVIKDYMQNIPAIGEAFNELTSQPDIAPNGYCIEWYLSDKEVKCMVKLKA